MDHTPGKTETDLEASRWKRRKKGLKISRSCDCFGWREIAATTIGPKVVTAGSKTCVDLPSFAETSQFQEFETSSDEDLEIQQALAEHQAEEESQLLEERAQLEQEISYFRDGELSAICENAEVPPPPTGPCRPQCGPECKHIIMCTRTRRRRDGTANGYPIPKQGFGGHSSQR